MLQERTRETVEHTGIGNDFLNTIPISQKLRERIDKWDCIKLKSFCTAKEALTRLKRLATKWDKIFASYSFAKGLIIKIDRKFKD
jgi:hypothetical protein